MSASPTYPRLAVLAERLADATIKGAVKWSDIENPSPSTLAKARTEIEDAGTEQATAFEYTRANGAVQIYSKDRDGLYPYVIRLVRGETIVESLETTWFSDDEPAPWNRPLINLYRIVRSQALGIDKFIDEILSDLPPADDIPF